MLGSCCLSAQSLQSQQQVTAAEYCDFLNHEAVSDEGSLYNQAIGLDPDAACIVRLGQPGGYRYEVIAGRENFPICYVNEVDEEAYYAVTGISLPAVNPTTEDLIRSNRDGFSVFLENAALTQMFAEPMEVAAGASWDEGVAWLAALGAFWFRDDLLLSRGDAPDENNVVKEKKPIEALKEKAPIEIGEEVHRITGGPDGDNAFWLICTPSYEVPIKGEIPLGHLTGRERRDSIDSDEGAVIEEKKSPPRNRSRSSSDLGRSKTPPLSFALGNSLVKLPENIKIFPDFSSGEDSELAGLLFHREIFSQEGRNSNEATALSRPSSRKETPLFDTDQGYISPATFAASYSPATVQRVYQRSTAYTPGLATEYSNKRDECNETDERVFQVLRSYIDVHGKSILDFGCGDGRLSIDLAHMEAGGVTGIDIAPKMVELAQAREKTEGTSNTQFFVTDGRNLHMPDGSKMLDGSQNVVFSHFVLQVFADTDPVFKEMNRVLVSGGWGVISCNITDVVRPEFKYLYNTPMPVRLGSEKNSVVVSDLIKPHDQITQSMRDNGFDIVYEEELDHPHSVINPGFKHADKLKKRAMVFVLRKRETEF